MKRILFAGALAFPILLASSLAAHALVLSCFPVRGEGVKIDAYVDAYAQGDYPPKTLESVRVLARFGEDVYELFPEHTKELTLRDDMLRIHLTQPLSAGETMEMRFEGKIGARKGEAFSMQMSIRNERRSAQASVRCTIE
jgi:hypothetical protein